MYERLISERFFFFFHISRTHQGSTNHQKNYSNKEEILQSNPLKKDFLKIKKKFFAGKLIKIQDSPLQELTIIKNKFIVEKRLRKMQGSPFQKQSLITKNKFVAENLSKILILHIMIIDRYLYTPWNFGLEINQKITTGLHSFPRKRRF